MELLSGPTQESFRVERRGDEAWKFFRPIPRWTHWQSEVDWLSQIDRRVELMQTVREVAGVAINTVLDWRRDELVLVTPFVVGGHPTVEIAKQARDAILDTPLAFLGDLTRWNMIESPSGLVLIDFSVYDKAYVRFKSMALNSPT